ncbi:MAG: tryptophan synthase subunit beta, partial [Clostridia bacterium]|nr:tryptophan synthase subunit beta [Clostridia bacterium]
LNELDAALLNNLEELLLGHSNLENNSFYKMFEELKKDKNFKEELAYLQKYFQGRPTPLYYCKKLTEKIGGAKIFLKREDLNHTGAHKINHCIGQALLAKHMGKKKIIAETGAGQHGLAIATVCALMDLECEIHMGITDIKKQKSNVDKIKLLGGTIVEVTSGDGTLKDAVESALSSYSKQFKTAMYCIGSVVGPHPFPSIVRDFQSVIGKEVKKQIKELENSLPNYIIACVGGGSNAMGIFNNFLKEKSVNLIAVEALGKGNEIGQNSATIKFGKEDVYQGFNTKVLKNNINEVCDAYSVASGLDYPAVGPQLAFLSDSGRVKFESINDNEALSAFYLLSKTEGIIPALESSHAVAYGIKLAKELDKNKTIVINLSGRGDKDVDFVLGLGGKNNE